jgi:hypothetical protein
MRQGAPRKHRQSSVPLTGISPRAESPSRGYRPRYETNGHLIEIIWDEECRVQVIDDTPRMGGGRLSDQIKEVSYVPHCHRDERAGRVV